MRRRRGTQIDAHPERAAVEAGLARGTPLRKLERRYGVSMHALFRHKKRMRSEQPEVFEALAGWQVPDELELLDAQAACVASSVIGQVGGPATAVALNTAVLTALGPYPEALAAVHGALNAHAQAGNGRPSLSVLEARRGRRSEAVA